MALAVVTGGNRGIGAAVAARLAHDGFDVVVSDLDPEPADPKLNYVRCDVTDESSVQALAAHVGEIAVLVNNAGVWSSATLAEETTEQARRVIDTNLWGTWLVTKHLGARFGAAGGAIVNLSSVLGAHNGAGRGLYPATKAAIIALTRQSAIEYAARGIRVNSAAPGLILTDGTAPEFGNEAVRSAVGAGLPLGRVGEASDVADVVSFLASDQARYVTGQVLFVDGGWYADAASSIFAPSA